MLQVAQTAEKCDSPIECAHSADSTEDAQSFQKKKNKTIPNIGIDLLGGDFCSSDHMLSTLFDIYNDIEESFNLTVFAIPDFIPHIEAFKFSKGLNDQKLHIIESHEVIYMEDDPLHSPRIKKDSSMCTGIRLLKEQKIDALVSTGNTGALIASSKMYLPMLPGISRAALITLLPTKKDPIAVIDVGANIQCSPDQLVQFSQMGIAYQKSRGIEHPKVGLLNIGTEEKKGRSELYETYQLLLKTPGFSGNIEGKEVFSGNIHVLVTDGFTGNIFLKTAEGISSFILDTIHQNQNIFTFLKPLLTKLEQELYSTEYPGAILCGIDGIIMKCHGDANPQALKYGVKGTLDLIHQSFLDKIKLQLASL